MPEFVYALIKFNRYGHDEIINIFYSMEKAVETCDFKNREENTYEYEVEQHRIIA